MWGFCGGSPWASGLCSFASRPIETYSRRGASPESLRGSTASLSSVVVSVHLARIQSRACGSSRTSIFRSPSPRAKAPARWTGRQNSGGCDLAHLQKRQSQRASMGSAAIDRWSQARQPRCQLFLFSRWHSEENCDRKENQYDIRDNCGCYQNEANVWQKVG